MTTITIYENQTNIKNEIVYYKCNLINNKINKEIWLSKLDIDRLSKHNISIKKDKSDLSKLQPNINDVVNKYANFNDNSDCNT